MVRTEDPSAAEASPLMQRDAETCPLVQLDIGQVNEFTLCNDLCCARRPRILIFRTSGKHLRRKLELPQGISSGTLVLPDIICPHMISFFGDMISYVKTYAIKVTDI